MRVAILESIVMPAGHEVEFDRILVEELKKQGHEPVFFVPEHFPFKLDYHCDVEFLEGGEAISYAGVSRLKRLWLSLKRERRRIAWLNSACEKGAAGKCDAVIVPTNSWRVMRSIRQSILKNSKIPFLFMFHGIMPKDRHRFCDGVKSLQEYPMVHLGALGLQTEFPELMDCPNFHAIMAPVYIPFDLSLTPEFHMHNPLRLGFFGQYRREKNLDFFLQAFIKAKFTVPVVLTVQGATATQVDSDDFERLKKEYAGYENIHFMHKNLLGIEWQKEIMDIDVMLLPYGAERYRYQPSAMLFTAIGYYKPVLQSPEMNPEILQEFDVGEAVKLDSVEVFSAQLEKFVNEFPKKQEVYRQGLIRANEKYGQDKLIRKVVEILSK
mgnify:FL=1|nr:hypothetical protein [uncultured Lachnoclostridium sp.]